MIKNIFLAQAGWQPIKTAPKDRPIMLCVTGFLPCVGRWWPVDSCWTTFDWEGHFESDKETSDHVNGSSYEPTHWMPLPPGPSVPSAQCETRNSEVLASFVEYCRAHPTERFWQALRNWSGRSFILASSPNNSLLPTTLAQGDVDDTFYWEWKDK